MTREAGQIMFVLFAGLVVAGCATTTPQVDTSSAREGMDRVSPIRAAEVNTRLGIGYMERDQLQLAVEKLQTALRFDSEHTPAHLTLALIYDMLGRDSAAGQHYRRASELAPNDGPTQNAVAVHLCQQGDFSAADRHFRRAMEDAFYSTPELAYGNAGACARRAGDAEKAEEYLRQALQLDPNYPDALFQLSELNLESGDAFRARAFLQRLESVSAADPAALVLGYNIESQLDNAAEADSYATRLQQLFPESSQAQSLRGLRKDDD